MLYDLWSACFDKQILHMATNKTHFVDMFSLKLGLVLFSFAMDYLSVNDRKQTTRWTATTFFCSLSLHYCLLMCIYSIYIFIYI